MTNKSYVFIVIILTCQYSFINVAGDQPEIVRNVESVINVLNGGNILDIFNIAEADDYLKDEYCELIRNNLTRIAYNEDELNRRPVLFASNPYEAQKVNFANKTLQLFYCEGKIVEDDEDGTFIVPGFIIGGTPKVDTLIGFKKTAHGVDLNSAYIVKNLDLFHIAMKNRRLWTENVESVGRSFFKQDTGSSSSGVFKQLFGW